MLPSGGYNKKIKVKRTFEGHFPGLIWHIFLGTAEASFYEWKMRMGWFREYLKKNVMLERHVLESEIRITLLLIANVAVAVWLFQSNIILAEIKYNFAKGESGEIQQLPIAEKTADLSAMLKLETDEVKELDKKEEKKGEAEASKNIKELNSVLPPQEEKCEEQKEEKISSDQCKQNYDEYLGELKKEEKERARKLNTAQARMKPRTNAPGPYVFDVVGGRKVCNKKNDKPSKSKNNKRGHMDMECCLDPDEIPNPHCYYSSSKYGKYLGQK